LAQLYLKDIIKNDVTSRRNNNSFKNPGIRLSLIMHVPFQKISS